VHAGRVDLPGETWRPLFSWREVVDDQRAARPEQYLGVGRIAARLAVRATVQDEQVERRLPVDLPLGDTGPG
jgi:hypothetical protein